MNVPSRIWSLSEFLVSTQFSYAQDSGTRQDNFFQFSDSERLHFDQLQSIWFRRPGKVKSPVMPEAWVERLIESECRNTLGGIFRSLECLMVNHPGADAESLYKLAQLTVAGRLGLNVPQTIVTADPEVAHQFYERMSGEVIYKLVGENTNFFFPRFEFPSGIPTLPCRQSDPAHFEQVRFAPHLFQQRVKKKFDVRATIVGREIFAASIHSQSGQSKLDWRLDYGVPMNELKLPEPVASACMRMMQAFKLNYAAFDFCVDSDDRYYFLELNCGGQYIWLEERTKLPISRQLALLLAGEAEPIVPSSAKK